MNSSPSDNNPEKKTFGQALKSIFHIGGSDKPKEIAYDPIRPPVQKPVLSPEQQQLIKDVPIELFFNVLSSLNPPRNTRAINYEELQTFSTGAQIEASFEEKGAGVSHASITFNSVTRKQPVDLLIYLIAPNRYMLCTCGEFMFTSNYTFLSNWLSAIPTESIISFSYVDENGEEFLLFNKD